jgi:hypothetical protein
LIASFEDIGYFFLRLSKRGGIQKDYKNRNEEENIKKFRNVLVSGRRNNLTKQ